MISKKLVVVTVVWGDWHIDQFLNLNLPTMMAADNFPSLSSICDIEYLIYTRKEDLTRIKESKIIRRLNKIAQIKYIFLKDHELLDPITTHHQCWNLGVNIAKELKAYILFMPPDVAWSNGSFLYVGQQLQQEKTAIYMTYLRVEDEAFIRYFSNFSRESDDTISLSGQQLVIMALRCVHPLMAAYLRNSNFFPRHPEMVLWPVPDEGLSCRLLAREMFIFYPEAVDLNSQKLLSNIDSFNTIKIINDSDHLFGVSLAKRSQEIDWYYLPLQADIYTIGNWWKNYDSLISDLLSSTKIRWHFRPVTEEKWALIEAAGDLFLRRAAIVREVRYLLTEIDKVKDFIISTNIIKYSLSRNLLSKVVRGRSGGIVFIPIDLAFHIEKFYENSHALLGVDSIIKLLIKAHYFPSKNITQIVKPRNNNQLYELLKCYGIEVNIINNEVLVGINSSRIIKEPIIIGHQLVCFIDRLLSHTQPILSNAFLA